VSVDFSQWAIPALPLTLGGRTYEVRPPCVADMRKLLACAVRAEVNLGVAKGPIPDDIQTVLDTIKPDDHPALGKAVYDQMVADGVHPTTIDRMAYYAVLYWTRGKTVADVYAAALWTPRDQPEAPTEEQSDLAGKALPTSRRSSGRRSGSANRSTSTSTGSRSTRTTDSPHT
jgi:hypothetical protein